jgi:hypothetical protein
VKAHTVSRILVLTAQFAVRKSSAFASTALSFSPLSLTERPLGHRGYSKARNPRVSWKNVINMGLLFLRSPAGTPLAATWVFLVVVPTGAPLRGPYMSETCHVAPSDEAADSNESEHLIWASAVHLASLERRTSAHPRLNQSVV